MKITPKYIEYKKWIYFPIKSRFIKDGLDYECIESDGTCKNCGFREMGCPGALCSSYNRKDKKDVIYIKL